MALRMEAQEYSSPLRKLVRFFRNSRDRWKAKCQEAKRTCKRRLNQVRALERSRANWKERATQLEGRIAELEAELQKTAGGLA
jgi:chromosome segregation ATPase